MNALPLSLYIHFPWCVRKCPYCDFNSHPMGETLDQENYIDALIADLDYELSLDHIDRDISSIFMGGGTPSLFSPESLHHLLGEVEKRIAFSLDIEITMEANPGTTEHHNFAGYREAGINRLSMGVQSFNSAQLKTLGRIHSADDARSAFALARSGGMKNINVDLMFGLPEQSLDAAMDDLDAALSLQPEHLSLYQLTLEPNTVFYRYPPKLPKQDAIVEIQQGLQQRLLQAGYLQYEVSAYSLPDKRCLHNLNYWQFGDYIGVGAGAHGKITTENEVTRRARKKHPATYLGVAGTSGAIAENRVVTRDEILFEFLMNQLRLIEGFDLNIAAIRTGIDRADILSALQKQFDRGLLLQTNDQIACTEKGYLFLDEILADLV